MTHPIVHHYVKLPIPVEAICFLENGWDYVTSALWCKDLIEVPSLLPAAQRQYEVNTLENPHMRVQKGDYIIKGVTGEFYPCRRDIFLKSYTRHTE